MAKNVLKREKISGALAIAAYMLSGIALLIWPGIVSTLALWVLVALLCAFAGVRVTKYLKTPPHETIRDFSLASALMALLVALLFLLDRAAFNTVMPFIWGILLLLAGFAKVQFSIDFLRLKAAKWWWMLIAAALSLTLGTLCAAVPAFLKDILPQFIGASLVFEGVIDIVAMVFFKKNAPASRAPAAPAPAPVAPVAPAEQAK